MQNAICGVTKCMVLYPAFLRMTTKEFAWEAICYLCSDLPCSCYEGTFCHALKALSHSEPCKKANWLTLKWWLFSTILQRLICSKEFGTALQNRHSAIISPNTPYQLVISLSLVLMRGAWLQVWSWIQQRQFIILFFSSVIYSYGGLLCLFMGSARILSSRYKAKYFVICFSVHE